MPFDDEILAYLEAQGVGVANTSIFVGPNASIPTEADGPFMSLIETGGMAPLNVHTRLTGYQRPSMQLLVRGADPTAVRVMLKLAYDALLLVRNTVLSGTEYLRITADQEPFSLTPEGGTGRARMAFNIRALKQPS